MTQGLNIIGSSLPRPRWGEEKKAKMDGGDSLRHPFLQILRNCVSSDNVAAVSHDEGAPASHLSFLAWFEGFEERRDDLVYSHIIKAKSCGEFNREFYWTRQGDERGKIHLPIIYAEAVTVEAHDLWAAGEKIRKLLAFSGCKPGGKIRSSHEV
jgi:hypothetical protein